MPSIDSETLTFIDLTKDNVGNFYDNGDFSEEYQSFKESPVGEAQIKSLVEEIKVQMGDDYEPTDSQIGRILYNEQLSQEQGYSSPDLTSEQMLDKHGPAWYEELGGALKNLFEKANNALNDGVKTGVDATVDGVTNNTGLTGNAVDAIINRNHQIDTAVEGMKM